MAVKKAIELESGDSILSFDDRPNFYVYRGVVRDTTVIDSDVQIN